ncbi:MAG TPA: OmpH family outer membrane protein [Stellaceae bacterium]|nr:OmpH family outer membrane protein [Stellaceae bacterium]
MFSIAKARTVARLAALLACLAAAPALAQQPALPIPAIIVVDTNQILRESKAAKDVQAQLEKQQSVYSKEVSQKESELKSLQDELERQRTVLSPDVFAARSQEFQRRYVALDHDVQVKRQALQQSLNEARDKINATALQIITDIAKDRKANIVMERAALIYMADGLDITAEVIRRLDDKLPALAVNLPKDTPPPAAAAPGPGPAPQTPTKK